MEAGCRELDGPLKLGVLHRVQEMGPESQIKEEDKRAYTKLIPQLELLGHTMGRRREAKLVGQGYHRICNELGETFRS